MKKNKLFVILFAFMLLFFLSTKAGYNDNNGNGNAYGHDKNPKEGTQVHVDGGITLLLAAAAALGAKKLFSKTKRPEPIRGKAILI